MALNIVAPTTVATLPEVSTTTTPQDPKEPMNTPAETETKQPEKPLEISEIINEYDSLLSNAIKISGTVGAWVE